MSPSSHPDRVAVESFNRYAVGVLEGVPYSGDKNFWPYTLDCYAVR
ncbi:MAG: hypothetical protein Q4C70_05770 [Planctomycetia bacterium]|nr:hypothetical protein [Planctomycetia bacterium]